MPNIDKIVKDLKNRKVFKSATIYLANATLLMAWGFVLILFFTALEGKYNYKLFHQNGSLITDNMFLPKFVALPAILYFLMVVVLFILFNVLF